MSRLQGWQIENLVTIATSGAVILGLYAMGAGGYSFWALALIIANLNFGWHQDINPKRGFHDWMYSDKPLEDYESHIKDGNFDHADVMRLMELAYNTGAGRI